MVLGLSNYAISIAEAEAVVLSVAGRWLWVLNRREFGSIFKGAVSGKTEENHKQFG